LMGSSVLASGLTLPSVQPQPFANIKTITIGVASDAKNVKDITVTGCGSDGAGSGYNFVTKSFPRSFLTSQCGSNPVMTFYYKQNNNIWAPVGSFNLETGQQTAKIHAGAGNFIVTFKKMDKPDAKIFHIVPGQNLTTKYNASNYNALTIEFLGINS